MESQSPTPRLLDQVRSFMRLHHYSIHTERTDRQTALRQRIANPGSRAAAGQGPGLSDETGDCEIGKRRQGPLYHAFGWFDSAAREPSAKGKGAP